MSLTSPLRHLPIIVLTGLWLGCAHHGAPVEEAPEAEEDLESSAGIPSMRSALAAPSLNSLGFDLYQWSEGENIVVAPSGVYFWIVALSAQSPPEWKDGLKNFIGHIQPFKQWQLESIQLYSELARLESAGGVQVHERRRFSYEPSGVLQVDWERDFLNHYQAAPLQTDFTSEEGRHQFDSWLRDSSHGRVLSVDMPAEASAFQLTSLHWIQAPFRDEFLAIPGGVFPFHTEATAIDVEGVAGEGRFQRYRTPAYEVVDIPYASRLRLMIVQPGPGEFEHVSSGFHLSFFHDLLRSMTATQTRVVLPRFTVESVSDRKPTLRSMGWDGLDNAQTFAHIVSCEQEDCVPGSIIEHVSMSVDIGGTNASPVGSASRQVPDDDTLIIDRPFLFVVYDAHTSAVIMLGRIITPVR